MLLERGDIEKQLEIMLEYATQKGDEEGIDVSDFLVYLPYFISQNCTEILVLCYRREKDRFYTANRMCRSSRGRAASLI